MKVLAIGDVVGSPGREIVKLYLKKYKENYDFVIVNGENAAAGFGITKKICDEFYEAGVDLITGGNHIWDKKEIYPVLDSDSRILRPINYPDDCPGKGYSLLNTKNDKKIGVINAQGRVFMIETDSPFEKVKEAVLELKKQTKFIIVDFHAEATSEKSALAWMLDGDISMLFGTHTHVLTADERVLTKGTGFITDIGMTGGNEGIIGMNKDNIIEKFLTSLPKKFEVCKQNTRINGIEIDLNDYNGLCKKITRINLSLEDLQ